MRKEDSQKTVTLDITQFAMQLGLIIWMATVCCTTLHAQERIDTLLSDEGIVGHSYMVYSPKEKEYTLVLDKAPENPLYDYAVCKLGSKRKAIRFFEGIEKYWDQLKPGHFFVYKKTYEFTVLSYASEKVLWMGVNKSADTPRKPGYLRKSMIDKCLIWLNGE